MTQGGPNLDLHVHINEHAIVANVQHSKVTNFVVVPNHLESKLSNWDQQQCPQGCKWERSREGVGLPGEGGGGG